MKAKFVTTSHKPLEKYGLGAKPTHKAFKETKWNGFKLAMIPKENIGIDSDYQRVADKTQVARINEKWDGDIYEFVNVYRHYDEKTRLHFYQATDGQHRLCAHPDDVVPCRIVNSKAPVTRCIEANDPRTKRAWSIDDQFWAKNAELNRVKSIKDEDQIKNTIKIFKSFGWNPVNPSKQVPTDIGGRIAKIHATWKTNTQKNLVLRVALSKKEKEVMSLSVLRDAATIMSEVFPSIDYVGYAGRVWTALFDWLSNEKHGLGCNYDINEIVSVFKGGRWGLRGPRKQRLETLKDFRGAAQEYIRKEIITDRMHLAYLKLFNDMFQISLR
tara:strand:+ start:135 stop:1118 length:984 start_codon:yes stop_codon:yes gene_type:complete